MAKASKRITFCKCVRKTCPMKYHVITDPDLRNIIREQNDKGEIVHLRDSRAVVFIERI